MTPRPVSSEHRKGLGDADSQPDWLRSVLTVNQMSSPTIGQQGLWRPRLCFVGPMIGRNPGRVTTQGELVADRFAAEGWAVSETSPHPRRPLRLLDTISCLIRWRRRVDLVVLSVFSGPGFVMADVSSMLTRLLGIPTVMWLHGGNLPEFCAAHPKWTQRVLRRAAHTVAPSTFLADLPGASERTVEVIPNLIDLSSLPFRPRSVVAPRLLWMRTFHPIYNPLMAVRAFARIKEHHPGATLTMAGQEKGILAEVRAEVQRIGLTDAVTFPGFLNPQAKAAAFEAHDIYLHTNHVDNAPVSVIEAGAAGLPIVATAVGGVPHLFVNGSSALLVPDDDDVAMAAGVQRLLSDPQLAEQLSANGRELAEHSSWPSVRERWVRAFETALGRG